MDRVWDSRGEARAALERTVRGFGAAVLGQADMLEGLLQDDIPQLPREVAMLTETARFGAAAMLGERVRHGVSAPSAVTMVATEMTSRTAVDSAGALWAAGVFAHVIGFGGATVPPVAQDRVPADVTLPPPAQLTRPETSYGDQLPTDQNTANQNTANQNTANQNTGGGTPWPGQFGQLAGQQASSLVAAGANATGLAMVSAAGTVLAVVLLGFWVLTGFNAAEDARNWIEMLPLVFGGIAAAIWALSSSASGTGLTALLGLTVPTISFGIYNAAITAEFTSEAAIRRYFIVGTSVLAVLIATAAAIAAAGAIGRRQLLGPRDRDGLAVLLTVFGLAFVLCSLFGQLRVDGLLVGNVEGHGVQGWFVLWGLVFLALYSVPPIVALFVRPGRAQLALWAGWLAVVLAWQVSDSPVDGLRPAYGLFLTWSCWLAVLVAAIALAVRQARRPSLGAQ